MIKFFRHIRQRYISEGKTTKYFKYAIGEIILVVIGILIALNINNWNENRKTKAHQLASMKEIIENLNYDILRCENNIKTNTFIVQGLDSLRASISNTIDGKDETANIYYYSFKYATDYSKAVLNKSAYDELINSGSVKGIANRALVQELSDYYERIAFTVPEFNPKRAFENLQTIRKKIISFKAFDGYIQSYDAMNSDTFSVDYDFGAIQKMEHLQLLQPQVLTLTDYYNEIAQCTIDLKTYMFYMSWAKGNAKSLIVDIQKEYDLTTTN
ncbi:hypothetical protein ES692_04960 [Psychroserpens burtonensis]|uniref:Uncharacterized protein n=1 Tax=Psychroserpens burtonensis TaxID=49278 RepID=A0A5C7BAE7_9FLAO|nr:DUF6090 family protein [Psychroserpens burtonensis]TXE18804.1 hypothetical protein ES692_04960 [Psychroserpens burtonensis]